MSKESKILYVKRRLSSDEKRQLENKKHNIDNFLDEDQLDDSCDIDDELIALLDLAAKNKYFMIWKHEDAPPPISHLTHQGGDEDYVAFVPANFWAPIFLSGPQFGCCRVFEYDVYLEGVELPSLTGLTSSDENNRYKIGEFYVGTHS